MSSHEFRVQVEWTGDRGAGTTTYQGYARDHVIHGAGKADIAGSSDPAFRGDAARYSPEELLVASLSACHMLWYLHLCADHGVAVTGYRDQASGRMEVTSGGAGRFVEVVLRPSVRISAASDPAKARELHADAHRLCFIANSVNFPVEIDGRDVTRSAPP